jgi:arylsulfatase
VTAEVVIPKGGANGVIVNQGGITGGWSLYIKDGKPKYCYNFVGLKHTYVESTKAIPEGTHQLRMEFAYDGGGMAKGGGVSLFLDGDKVGEGRVDMTAPLTFSLDETTNVGDDTGAPVTPDYKAAQNAFTGTINWVKIDIGKGAHEPTPEAKLKLAVARQ